MLAWLQRIFTRHLPDPVEPDHGSMTRAERAVEISDSQIVEAQTYYDVAHLRGARISRSLSRNHLAPSFEAAYRRAPHA